MTGFWTGGRAAYVTGLDREYREKRRQLKEQFDCAPNRFEKLKILRAAKSLDDEYEDSLRGTRYNIH